MAEIKSFVDPRRLYRYRSLESFDREMEAIEEGYLYCSAYEDLNDPMEGRYTSSRKLRNRPDHREIKEAIFENKARVGICSFSEVHDHEVMWAHYADHFRGICIAYSVRLLLQNLPADASLVRMSYDEKAPNIINAEPGPERLAKMILSNKSYRWLYEREWRLFGRLGKVYYGNSHCITDVYLGYRISRDCRKAVATILRRLGIESKKMGVSKYVIEFE